MNKQVLWENVRLLKKKKVKYIVIAFFLLSIIIISLTLTLYEKSLQSKFRVGIYTGPGTWEPGIEALEAFFEEHGIKYYELEVEEILNETLEEYSLIIVPGGWAWDYYIALTAEGAENLKEYVREGGGYIGICAGAYYACELIIWNNHTYMIPSAYPIGLINCTARGPRSEYPWPACGDLEVKINLSNPFLKNLPETFVTYYCGGPEFLNLSKGIEVLAWYTDETPAIISAKYGKGLVVLMGVHLEVKKQTWPLLLAIVNMFREKLKKDSESSNLWQLLICEYSLWSKTFEIEKRNII
ncbi:hypothetical protein DRO69_04470 [Candidatus Bathyarchaeota archaeon]|nr:MAG: hypothetical protein DRO69_04470 [Candidatus Bathyarchaeota archaeon]